MAAGATASRSAAASAPGPLAGLQVVELGDGTAGPYAAKLLADYGAEVVKIEAPGAGDSSRRRGPFPSGRPDPEWSGLFLYLNTNKYGLTLDVSGSAGRAVLERLLGWADTLVTNLPAETLRTWDLAPAALRARHPRLVITTITPFGLDGPCAGWRGDELVTYAMGGIAYGTPGMPDAAEDLQREPPLHPACFAAETIAGVAAATATLLAVFGRERTGEGCHADISQQAAVAVMQQRDVTTYSYAGVPYNRLLNPTTIGRMPNFYLPCRDGYVAVAAPMDHQWERLVEAMGNPDWARSPAFADAAARSANWSTLCLRLIEWTMTLTGNELFALAERLRLPIFPFYPLGKMVDSEHVRERGSLVELEVGGHRARMPGPPILMPLTPWALRRPAPRLGEHTRVILGEWLGYDDTALGRLSAAAVV
ncbi:MAG: CoA transferase [Candidatus Rokubacteria bacterium]|nr:CoA transferase [Candidatus Rokubacteria bacterium]